jgi:hypothetical protein
LAEKQRRLKVGITKLGRDELLDGALGPADFAMPQTVKDSDSHLMSLTRVRATP